MGTPPPIELANLGMADSLILMVMALVVFGPRRLPQIGRQIGKLMYEFRKASNDFKYQMEEELRSSEEADRRKKDEERLKALALAAPPAPVAPATPAESPYSESMAGAPAPTEPAEPAIATLTESPYAEGMVYPPLSAATTLNPLDEPRIQPPSTGETVAAARPNRKLTDDDSAAAQVNPEADVEANAAESAPIDVAPACAPPAAESQEQAAHHG